MRFIDKATPSVMKAGLLGIDIGSSSIKLVQMSLRAGKPVLETFGELDISSYASADGGRTSNSDGLSLSSGILDLEQEVEASARSGGLAIPLGSVLLFTAETPKRDDDQMQHILPSEVKRYIPLPLETVTLDWQVLDEKIDKDAFAGAAGRHATPMKQTILVAAVKNTAMSEYRSIAASAGMQNPYFEIEAFSVARVCGKVRAPTLLIDLGASTTKLYCLNERGLVVGSHVMPQGADAVTESIRRELGVDFEQAQRIKHSYGTEDASELGQSDKEKLTAAISAVLEPTSTRVKRALDELVSTNPWKPQSAILSGGGALLSGVSRYYERALSLPCAVIQPFEHVSTPMILEQEIRGVGPKYAVAVGVALCGLRTSRP